MLRSRHQNPGHGTHPCSSPSPPSLPSLQRQKPVTVMFLVYHKPAHQTHLLPAGDTNNCTNIYTVKSLQARKGTSTRETLRELEPGGWGFTEGTVTGDVSREGDSHPHLRSSKNWRMAPEAERR